MTKQLSGRDRGRLPARRVSISAPSVAGATSAACLAYVLWRPVSNQVILLPVLAILAVSSSLIVLRSDGRSASQHLRVAVIMTLLLSISGLTIGSFRNTPGLAHQGQLWIGMLLIWLPWCLSINIDRIRVVLETLAIVLSVLSAVIILYVLAQRGIGPALVPESVLLGQEAGFAETQGGSAIRLYGLSTLAAGGPLMAACMVAGRDDLLPRRWLSVTAGILVLVATMLAGRRAIAAVTLASPAILLVIQTALQSRSRKVRLPPWLVILTPVIALLVAVLPASTALIARGWAAMRDGAALFLGLGSAVSVDKGLDDELRQDSARELIAAWGDNPIFGSGLGGDLPSGFARNAERPWLFELQYHQFLFNFGLMGVVWAFGMVVLVVSATRMAARKLPMHVPVVASALTAAICLLIANGSNPYLQTFGHGWGIALAAGVINGVLMRSGDPQWKQSVASPLALKDRR